MKVRGFVLFLLLLILFTPIKSYGETDSPKAYLIIMNRLVIDDVQSMTNMQNIVSQGSTGLMNTRGVSGYMGPESYITINSSRKALANYNTVDFQTKGNKIVNMSMDRLINLNENNNFSPFIGALGDNLEKRGFSTGIYGNSDLLDDPNRTSALIPMNSKGTIDHGNINNITVEEESYPFGLKTDYPKLLREVLGSPADFIVVDTGDLERIFRYNGYLDEIEYMEIRNRILLDLDNFIGDLAKNIDRDNSLLIITSPNSGDTYISDSKLSPIIIWGKSFNKGTLSSASTHRNMIVSNVDLGSTVMDFFDSSMDNMSGNPIKNIENNISLVDIINENQRINITSRVRYNTLYFYGIFSMILLLIATILLLARIRLTGGIGELFKVLCLLLLIIPSLFIIESIFRPKTIYSFLIILITLIISALIILWKTRRYRNQSLYIGAITILIIALDLILHGKISRYSVLSHDPIIGARYYGIGNEMVGLFLGSIIIIGTTGIGKAARGYVYLLILTLSIIFTGYPLLGANVGGTIAFIITLIFFILEYNKISLSLKRAMFIIFITVSFLVLMGYMDITFSRNITHLGKTILLIKNNGLYFFRETIFRKLLMNIKLVGRSFWTNLLLLHMIMQGLIFYLGGLKEHNMVGFISGIAGVLGGFLLNDSGLILASISMNMLTIKLYLDYTWSKVK